MISWNIVHRKKLQAIQPPLIALVLFCCAYQNPHPQSINVQKVTTGIVDYYLQQMPGSTDDNKIGSQLLTIRELLNEGKLSQADDKISQLPKNLSDTQKQEQRLLQAQLSNAKKNLSTTAYQLSIFSLPKEHKSYHIDQKNCQSLDFFCFYIAQESLLSTYADKKKNIDATWQALVKMIPNQVNSLTINANEPVQQGWLELLVIYRAQLSDRDMLKAGIIDWQKRYPHHPAAQILPSALSRIQNFQPASTQKIGLLLPLSGRAKVFGNTIQKGFNDARNDFLAKNTSAILSQGPEAGALDVLDANATTSFPNMHSETSPQTKLASSIIIFPSSSATIQVYDTNRQPIEQVLEQAKKKGTTLVVGPLLKNNVEKMVSSQTTLNVLALNEPKTVQIRPNICYFSLSPEDETRDAAHHMWGQGKRNPLLLVPRSELGDRINKAFAKEWEKLDGGTVLQQQFGSSIELKKGMNSGIGIRLSGTPVNVQSALPISMKIGDLNIPTVPPLNDDHRVDSVYIVSTQDELALIKPMISMYVSSRDNVGLYASSRSNQAGMGADYRLELDGLQFSDAPFLSGENPILMQQAAKIFKNDYSLMRLYAMGIDAWNLSNKFNEMRSLPDFQIKGNTGSLSVDKNCLINRKLLWSQYRQGKVVPVS